MEDPQKIAAIANVWKLTENNSRVTQDETRLGENQLNLLCRAEKLIQVRRKKLICPCMTVSLWRSSLKRIIHCRWLSEPMSVSWSGPQEVLMIWWFTALPEFTWKRKFNMNQHFYALISYSYLTYTIFRPIFSLHLSSRFRMVSSALPTVNSLQSSVPRSATRQNLRKKQTCNTIWRVIWYHIVGYHISIVVSQIES